MTADRRDDEPAPPDLVDDADPVEAPSWAQATTEMAPDDDSEPPEDASRRTAELSQAALLEIADEELPVEPQVSVEEVALEADTADAETPWDGPFSEQTGELDLPEEPVEADFAEQPTQIMDGAEARQMAEEPAKPGPPPAPADADDHPGPPPTLDVPDELLSGHQWQAERRSIRRPHAKLSADAINQAIRVADVDSRPLQRREQKESHVDPWQTVTPGAGLEGQIALEVLGQVRRGTQRPEVVEKARFGLMWWLGAAVVVGLMAFAAIALYRTQTAADEAMLEPVEPVAEPAVPVEAPVQVADRRDLRNGVFEAFREGDYVRAVSIGQRLESEFHLDWEVEFILAEAARLSRHFDDAVARYAEFIRRYPNNVRNDDAHFWMAEAMRLQGNLKGARRHYRAVVDNRRSNMRSLAKKRLAAMK